MIHSRPEGGGTGPFTYKAVEPQVDPGRLGAPSGTLWLQSQAFPPSLPTPMGCLLLPGPHPFHLLPGQVQITPLPPGSLSVATNLSVLFPVPFVARPRQHVTVMECCMSWTLLHTPVLI